MTSIKGRYFRQIMAECGAWKFSIIGDRPFIVSDKCTQKYAHCIVLCGLRTSSLYNIPCLFVILFLFPFLLSSIL